ncbi:unnamed protein product [Effrenium voratum]|uniref:Uncharacterized protein n=1 Tax=Effrenium voratum TaxID=2562239 RepID=A0AA36IA26_9DINO|nr:unnamed protein product [Effrenium voratum]
MVAEHGVPICRPQLCRRSSAEEPQQRTGETTPFARWSRLACQGCARGQQCPGVGAMCIRPERWASWLARSRGGGDCRSRTGAGGFPQGTGDPLAPCAWRSCFVRQPAAGRSKKQSWIFHRCLFSRTATRQGAGGMRQARLGAGTKHFSDGVAP